MPKKRKRPSIFEEMIRRMRRQLERAFRPLEERRLSEEEFEDPFERMMKRFEETPGEFKELVREEETPSGKVRRYGPIVYGFSYSKRPGEEPEIQEFGNIRPGERGKIEPIPKGEREPLVDVADMGDRYEVTVEIPGVKEDEIDLSATEDSMKVKTTGERKFRKEVYFEDPVDPDEIEANFKYGVLYADIKKEEPEKGKGRKIKIK